MLRRLIVSALVAAFVMLAPASASAVTPTYYLESMGQLDNPRDAQGVPNGVWNTPLADNAAIDPESSSLVGVLRQWFPGPTGNRANFTTNGQLRIWIATSSTPLVRVVLDPGAPYQAKLQQVFNQVPFPAGAQPSTGTDERMAIYQPQTNCFWEFWHLAFNTTDGLWHAGWGGRDCGARGDFGVYQNVQDAAGNILEQPSWGGSATSMTQWGGAPKVDELAHGVIPHATTFAIDFGANCSKVWNAPAQRTDGQTAPVYGDPTHPTEPTNCIPEGARFRLPPPCPTGVPSTMGVCFNLSDLAGDPPLVTQLAAAVQKYGLIDINSTAGGVVGVESAAAGDPPYLALGADPYTTAIAGEANTPFFGSYTNQNALALFPWSWLELLQMNVTSTQDPTVYVEPDPPSPFWPTP